MLVLTRRSNQSILIGADVTVTVLEVRGDQVRLGIDAPREIPVYREEVLAQIRAENQRASAAAAGVESMLPKQRPSRPPTA